MRPSNLRRKLPFLLAPALLAFATSLAAQQTPPQSNTSTLDPDGTARITRVIPIPADLSPEAKEALRRTAPPDTPSLAERRKGTDAWQARAGQASLAAYPVHIESITIAGVPVRNVTPLDAAPAHPDRVLINVHGGGFNSDSGSFTESIPIANLTHTRVVSILYRLAPEHPFPAAVDDTVAVYRELLKTYKPTHIALYGTSAGAILTAQVAVRLRQLQLPLPAALGVFSGLGDFSRPTDSQAMYSLRGLTGSLPLVDPKALDLEYIGSANPKDPVVSPLFADLHNMPPTLFITSGRDLLLSGTTILHRAFVRNGNNAQLIVFEGLPHAFWNDISLPETKEAYGYMADFFTSQLSH